MQKKEISRGFFGPDLLNAIDKTVDLIEAKKLAVEAVKAQPNARESNIKKAIAVINYSRDKKELLISLANFMLAHPSENLSMSKGETVRPTKKKMKK